MSTAPKAERRQSGAKITTVLDERATKRLEFRRKLQQRRNAVPERTEKRAMRVKCADEKGLAAMKHAFEGVSAVDLEPEIQMEKRYDQSRCASCKRKDAKMVHCIGCGAAPYCSQECTVKDREAHSDYCLRSQQVKLANREKGERLVKKVLGSVLGRATHDSSLRELDPRLTEGLMAEGVQKAKALMGDGTLTQEEMLKRAMQEVEASKLLESMTRFEQALLKWSPR